MSASLDRTRDPSAGWGARVDGAERPLLRADSIFRGLALDAGTHRVRLEYRPASWTRGLLGASAGALGLLALVGWLARARARAQVR